MGFYTMMLREEEELMGNTGFDPEVVANPDDKYEVEVKDIAQAIEDINADYADQSAQEELDGQDLQDNPVEECAIAIFESEQNWNMIMKAIGTHEVLEAARGREMVMEAVDVKGFFTNIKNFFVKMFKKITAIIKNWIDNAMAAFSTNKKFVEKYGNKLADGKKAYEADPDKKPFKGYKFKTNDLGEMKAGIELATKGSKNTVDDLNKVISAINSGKDLKGIDIDFGDVEVIEKADMKKQLFGSDEKVTLDDKYIAPEYLLSVLKRTQKDISGVKKAYNVLKKSINEVIHKIDSIEKAVTKASFATESDRAVSMNTATKALAAAKKEKNNTQMMYTMSMKAISAEMHQARRIANAYIFALNKKTRKGKIDAANGKVATESGFLSGIELI